MIWADVDLVATPPAAVAAPDATRLDRLRARLAAGGQPKDGPQRHRAPARPRLPGPRDARVDRRVPAGGGDLDAAAAPRGRRGGGRGDRDAHGDRRGGRG